MKAKLMSILDTNDPNKVLFGIKLIGLRRPVYVIEGTSFYETCDKNECKKKIKEVQEYLLKNPKTEELLKSNKNIQGLRI